MDGIRSPNEQVAHQTTVYQTDDEELLTEKDAGRFLGCAIQTLRNWRSQGRGPQYLKYYRSIKYRVGDLKQFRRQHTIRPGSIQDRRG
jgi:hypothetical protein